MVSAVLDTNILASGTVSALNAPGQILDAWRDGKFLLVTSNHIMNELQRTFNKPYFQQHITTTQVSAFIDLLRNEALVTPITVNVKGVATHPEDDLMLATAVSAKADYLVTGDGPFLRKVGVAYEGVALLTPQDFLRKL